MTRLRFPIRLMLLPMLLLTGTTSGAAADDGRTVREAVEVARTLRASDDFYDQIAGAGTLVDIGDEEALQFLTNITQHRDESLRRSAIDTLLTVRHPSGLAVVRGLALHAQREAPRGEFVRFLLQSLASQPRDGLTDVLVGSLALRDRWVTKHALHALAPLALGEHQARIREIADDESQAAISRACAHRVLLGTSDEARSVAVLVGMSATGDLETKELAAIGIGQVDNDATRSALQRMHAETDPYVHLAVLTSEAGFGVEAAIEELIDTIVNGRGLLGPAAAASLRRLPTRVAIRVSDAVVSSGALRSNVAARLIESWGSIDAEPASVYHWGLQHRHADVRMQTVWLVGQRGALDYLEFVVPMLRDSDSGIRGMAAWTVVRLLGNSYEPGTET